jgi:hypothetical protein
MNALAATALSTGNVSLSIALSRCYQLECKFSPRLRARKTKLFTIFIDLYFNFHRNDDLSEQRRADFVAFYRESAFPDS